MFWTKRSISKKIIENLQLFIGTKLWCGWLVLHLLSLCLELLWFVWTDLQATGVIDMYASGTISGSTTGKKLDFNNEQSQDQLILTHSASTTNLTT